MGHGKATPRAVKERIGAHDHPREGRGRTDDNTNRTEPVKHLVPVDGNKKRGATKSDCTIMLDNFVARLAKCRKLICCPL